MARFYDIDDANARIPEVREVLADLRDQREELVRLRDEALERQSVLEAGVPGGGGAGHESGGSERDPPSCAGSAFGCRASSTRCRPP